MWFVQSERLAVMMAGCEEAGLLPVLIKLSPRLDRTGDRNHPPQRPGLVWFGLVFRRLDPQGSQ